MSNTLDQERREFDELCKNNPNYPKDFELHRMYQSHIKKWKPLIESNDPSIYSEWNDYKHKITNVPLVFGSSTEYDHRQIDFIFTRYLSKSPSSRYKAVFTIEDLLYQYSEGGHWSTRVEKHISPTEFMEHMSDRNMRRELMLYCFSSYINFIECVPDEGRWRDGDRKSDIIELFQYVDDSGNNPFDLTYHLKGVGRQRSITDTALYPLLLIILLFLCFLLDN